MPRPLPVWTGPVEAAAPSASCQTSSHVALTAASVRLLPGGAQRHHFAVTHQHLDLLPVRRQRRAGDAARLAQLNNSVAEPGPVAPPFEQMRRQICVGTLREAMPRPRPAALIAPRIALKRRTALDVFHSDLDRLSVDIDVNYVGALEKERMDADRPGLEDRIERLMESNGYVARHELSEHAGGK
jgi:hypothetical protein